MWLFFCIYDPAFTIQYFFFNKMNTCQMTIFDVLADSSPSGIQLFWQRSHLEQTRELASLAFHLWMVPKMGLPSSHWEKEEKGTRCTTTWDMTIGPMIMTKTLDFWCALPFLIPFRPKIFNSFISWWKSWFSFRILTCFQLGKALDLLLEISALTAQSLFLFAKKSLKSEKC